MANTQDNELNIYRRRLLKMLQRLDNEKFRLREEALRPGGGEASGGLSNAPIHLADLGSHQFEEEMDLRLMENEEYLINELDAALDRIDQQTFGRCESCERDISRERLQAVPYTRYCFRCAKRLEEEVGK